MRRWMPIGLMLLCAAAPRSAVAANDLITQVKFTIVTQHAAGALTSVTATIEVDGNRIASATVTPPMSTTPFVLTDTTGTGTSFALEQTFTTEADLAMA